MLSPAPPLKPVTVPDVSEALQEKVLAGDGDEKCMLVNRVEQRIVEGGVTVTAGTGEILTIKSAAGPVQPLMVADTV